MKYISTLILTALLSMAAWAAEMVNINTATVEEIAEGLKGVGLSKAEAIVNYRDSNGQFKHIDELVNVKGIGIRTVDMNRGVIVLEGGAKLASSKK